MTKKPVEKPASKPTQGAQAPAPPKKKLSLDVSDVSEVLERKNLPVSIRRASSRVLARELSPAGRRPAGCSSAPASPP